MGIVLGASDIATERKWPPNSHVMPARSAGIQHPADTVGELSMAEHAADCWALQLILGSNTNMQGRSRASPGQEVPCQGQAGSCLSKAWLNMQLIAEDCS